MVQLKELAEEVDRYREAVRREEEWLKSEIQAAFSELRSVVLAGQPIPPELEKRASGVNHHFKEKVEDLKKKMGEQAVRAEKVFSQSQKKVIADFQPCLIPPRNLKNPERVGQADSSGLFENVLTRLREVPEWRFDTAFDRFFQRHMGKTELHLGPLDEEVRRKEKDRLYAVACQARRMSDVDFSLKRGELAQRMGEEGLLKDDRDLASAAFRRKLARLFLRPGTSEIYAQRLQLMQESSD